MKNLYKEKCDGVFWVFGNQMVDLSKTDANNPKPVEDRLADRLLADFEGTYVFEAKAGKKIPDEVIKDGVPGVDPFMFDWATIPISEMPQNLEALGFGEIEGNENEDAWNSVITEDGTQLYLEPKQFMYEMDFIECSDDVEDDEPVDDTAELEAFLKAHENEDPKLFKGMKEYVDPMLNVEKTEKEEQLESDLALKYPDKKKRCIELDYDGKDGYTTPELDKFLKNRK